MEMRFPDRKQGYDGLFFVGWRKSITGTTNAEATERTGTVVLKRTYDIDTDSRALMVSKQAPLVFLRDYPDNLVRNGDFESDLLDSAGRPKDWQTEGGAIIERVADPRDPTSHWLKVSGPFGGQVVQTIDFGERLAGQAFILGISARSDAPTSIEAVRLEAEGAKAPICVIISDLETKSKMLSPPEPEKPDPGNPEPGECAWPMWNGWNTTVMRLVLPVAMDANRSVFYDDVHLYNALRYEHDLASYKPEGDIIVLGHPGSDGNTAELLVDGDVWLSRLVGPKGRRHLFGWASRTQPKQHASVANNRRSQAGTFPEEDKNSYPLPEFPADFDNRFFNGYYRRNVDDPNFLSDSISRPYVPATAHIAVSRGSAAKPYSFVLRGDVATARYWYQDGQAPDSFENWQSRNVPMNIDTLVIEPDENRCYLVWRGVWQFDDRSEDAYRLLEVKGSA